MIEIPEHLVQNSSASDLETRWRPECKPREALGVDHFTCVLTETEAQDRINEDPVVKCNIEIYSETEGFPMQAPFRNGNKSLSSRKRISIPHNDSLQIWA